MDSVTRFVARKLRLQVNDAKSAVGRPWDRPFLGFCFTNSRANPLVRVHWKTIQAFRRRVRELTSRTCGRSLPHVTAELMRYMKGWWQYFGIAASVNRLRPLAHWVRRRLRALVWREPRCGNATHVETVEESAHSCHKPSCAWCLPAVCRDHRMCS